MSLGVFLPVRDQTVLDVITSQKQYLVFYSLFNFRIGEKIALKRLSGSAYKWRQKNTESITAIHGRIIFFPELEHKMANSKTMGKRQDRPISGNIWIGFSALSFTFIGTGLLDRKD